MEKNNNDIDITFATMGLVSGAHSRSRPEWLRK